MEFGDMIHKALSRVAWLDEGDVEEQIAHIVDYTRNNYARSSTDELYIEQRILPLLTETLLDPDLKFLFYRGDRDIVCKNELPIYFEDEKKDVSAHIDRLLIGRDEIVIMDYKTGGEKPEYKHQMRVYKRGIEKIYPDKRIRTIIVYLERERGKKIIEV
jgi:ATP-dependent exoDNAse (exonuclease V) beta subunit